MSRRRTAFSLGEITILLSPAEVKILAWLSKGKRYNEIAEIEDITESAVYQRAHLIMNKLGTNTAAGAVSIALRAGVIT